jgi:hypothetical protein
MPSGRQYLRPSLADIHAPTSPGDDVEAVRYVRRRCPDAALILEALGLVGPW